MERRGAPWKTEEERRKLFIHAFNMQKASEQAIDEAINRVDYYIRQLLLTRQALQCDDQLWSRFLLLKGLPADTLRDPRLLAVGDFPTIYKLEPLLKKFLEGAEDGV